MIIKLENITFAYSKKKTVLHNLNINVPKGAIYGFIGPNGAGKSTVMQLITGILPNKIGKISLFDAALETQIPSIFHKIGALVESPTLYLHLSGIDNLRCITTLKNLSEDKIKEVLQLVNLSNDGHQKVKRYSLGMRQRLAIAMTLLGDPELLLLDEPVNGLDPNGINDIRELLLKLNKEKGITIFISSHLLSEIEKMCSHIGIINNGEIKFEGTIKELADKTSGFKVSVSTNNVANYLEILQQKYGKVIVANENQFTVELPNKESVPDFSKFLIANNIPLYELKIVDGLEEWFFSLTK